VERSKSMVEELELAHLVSTIKDQLVMTYVEETRSLAEALTKKTIELAQKNESLHRLLLNTIESLAATLEARDNYTEGHSRRVAMMAKATSQGLGWDQTFQESLEIAGLLHDLGKIGIPDAILNKPARLTEREFARMKDHPLLAAQILGKIEGLEEIARWVRYHHERMDGQGYPEGLAGKAIPLGARILAVADAYDAMVSDRPYRQALSPEEAVLELQKGRGRQFDENILEVFLTVLDNPVLDNLEKSDHGIVVKSNPL